MAIAIAAVVALVAAALGGLALGSDDRGAERADAAGEAPSTTVATAAPPTPDEAAVAQMAGGAVWRVEVSGCETEASGSAWAIDPRHLVTNEHVVAMDPTPVLRSREGRTVSGTVIGTSRALDIAVIQVDEDVPVVLEWTETDDLAEGQRLIGLGYPAPAGDFSATPGTLVSFEVINGTRAALRTDAALDYGNSGGPMVTMEGRVAGVVTRMADNEGGFQDVPLAYTEKHLRSRVNNIIRSPEQVEPDCEHVEGAGGPEGEQAAPYVPPTYPAYVPEYDYEEPPTTTRPPCPTGQPTVTVTSVEYVASMAPIPATEYSPAIDGSWRVEVRGSITNAASAEVAIGGVEISLHGSDSTPYGSANNYYLRPGETTSFSASDYHWGLGSPSGGASASLNWTWSDYVFAGCGVR